MLDITGARTLLGTVAVPAGATGLVKGIRATLPNLQLALGPHTLAGIAVVMKDAQGKRQESDPNQCTYVLNITPGSPTSFTVTL